MPVDLEYIWRYLQFKESEKKCPMQCTPVCHGVQWNNTWGSLGQNCMVHAFFNIKWS